MGMGIWIEEIYHSVYADADVTENKGIVLDVPEDKTYSNYIT
jgi:hypothetical protein